MLPPEAEFEEKHGVWDSCWRWLKLTISESTPKSAFHLLLSLGKGMGYVKVSAIGRTNMANQVFIYVNKTIKRKTKSQRAGGGVKADNDISN
jgi:hypothetical protein